MGTAPALGLAPWHHELTTACNAGILYHCTKVPVATLPTLLLCKERVGSKGRWPQGLGSCGRPQRSSWLQVLT